MVIRKETSMDKTTKQKQPQTPTKANLYLKEQSRGSIASQDTVR
jgi:hypothetical protein